MMPLLNRLLGRTPKPAAKTAAAPQSPQPVDLAQARLAEYKANGLKVPAAAFLQLAEGAPSSVIEYTIPGTTPDKTTRYRYETRLEDGELSISHQVQCMQVQVPHPQDPAQKYWKPEFLETSRLSGMIEGDFAYVAKRVLVHIYGAVEVMPATHKDLLAFRDKRLKALANRCEPLAPPPLPSPARIAAQQARAAAFAAETEKTLKALAAKNKGPA